MLMISTVYVKRYVGLHCSLLSTVMKLFKIQSFGGEILVSEALPPEKLTQWAWHRGQAGNFLKSSSGDPNVQSKLEIAVTGILSSSASLKERGSLFCLSLTILGGDWGAQLGSAADS